MSGAFQTSAIPPRPKRSCNSYFPRRCGPVVIQILLIAFLYGTIQYLSPPSVVRDCFCGRVCSRRLQTLPQKRICKSFDCDVLFTNLKPSSKLYHKNGFARVLTVGF